MIDVTCQQCGKTFAVKPNEFARGRGKFCSRRCASRSKPVIPIEKRFFKKILKTEDGCWLWTGAKSPNGYGHLRVEKKTVQSHRLAWEVFHKQSVPDGMDILHTCDVKACCRVDHLFLGTAKDNVADMIAKGRRVKSSAKGARNAGAKLTEADVLEIRRRVSAGELQKDLASQYSLNFKHISRIIRRKAWRHI